MKTRATSKGAYLEFMLKSPLSVWWAAATFAAEILVSLLPSGVIDLPILLLAGTVFLVSLCVYVSSVALYKGWVLYSRASNTISVLEMARDDNGHVFVLEDCPALELGSVLEVHRRRESVEIPVGFIESDLRREDGRIQARPVWMMPVHVRDIEAGILSAQSLTVHATMKKQTLLRWFDYEAEQRVQGLLGRGAET
jgi:hypothetical protein